MSDPCKCGWRESDGIHRCHARLDLSDYTRNRCPNEGTPRTRYFVEPNASLAGMQMKFATMRYDTVACDECWAEMLEQIGGKSDPQPR